MGLEATIIIVDNSEHARNGDYLPSRFEAQADAVHLIFNAKTQANPESSVGLMSMGGSQPEVLTTLTTEFGKVIDGIHRTKIRGSSHFSTALNVASLALKHRQNKSQHQRVIVFTCSPLAEDEKSIIKLAKRLKKNNIAVDIVCFGDLEPDTVGKVEKFHENVKSAAGSDDQSNLAVVPPGPNLLSDSIVATSILAGEGMSSGDNMAGVETGGADAGGEFGFDPNNDPELALALRMSMEEEERRRERETREAQEKENSEKQPLLEPVPEAEEKGESSKDGDKKDEDEPEEKMDTS